MRRTACSLTLFIFSLRFALSDRKNRNMRRTACSLSDRKNRNMRRTACSLSDRKNRNMRRTACSLTLNAFITTVFFYILQYLQPAFRNDENQGFCESWRFNVEVNNIRGWASLPSECVDFVNRYIEGRQYHRDIRSVIDQARSYVLNEVVLAGDNKDAWVLDIDETALSNLDYYRTIRYGASPYNHSKYFAWVKSGNAKAIGETLTFYNELRQLGFMIFLITGRRHIYRNVTESSLVRAGYTEWEGVLMREADDKPGRVSELKVSKRMELINNGYRIWGNIGDQWSDISGYPVGNRAFKLPNPMYHVS